MTSRSFLIPRHLCQTPDLALICIALYYRRVSVVFAKSHTPAIPLPQQQGPVLPPTCAISPPAVATPPRTKSASLPTLGQHAALRWHQIESRWKSPAGMDGKGPAHGLQMCCRGSRRALVVAQGEVVMAARPDRTAEGMGRASLHHPHRGPQPAPGSAALADRRASRPGASELRPRPRLFTHHPPCTGRRRVSPTDRPTRCPPASLQPAYPQIVTRRTASHRRPVTPPRRCSPSPARRWRPRWPDAGPRGPGRRRGSGAPPAGGGACR